MPAPDPRIVLVKVGEVLIPGKVIGEEGDLVIVNPGAPGLRYLFAKKSDVQELPEGEDGTIWMFSLGMPATDMEPATIGNLELPPAVASRLAYLGLRLELGTNQGTLVLMLKNVRVRVTA